MPGLLLLLHLEAFFNQGPLHSYFALSFSNYLASLSGCLLGTHDLSPAPPRLLILNLYINKILSELLQY